MVRVPTIHKVCCHISYSCAMEENQRNRRKVRKKRRKGYRRLLKKPLKGYSYRQKKFVSKKLEESKPVTEALSEAYAQSAQVPSTTPLWDVRVCLSHKPQANVMQRGIRCLSLFDGIGSGYYALEDLGISVEAYFSSEIDMKALSVLKFHYHDRITMLGSVTKITTEVLECLGQIDLLIGGSPCEQLSLCNPRRQGFGGKDSTALLFFEYARILEWLRMRARAQNRLFYFLFENTAAMEVKNKELISRTLGCNPVQRCSSKHVPMVRKRLFWGNIPELHSISTQFKEQPAMQSFLMPYHKAAVDKVRTLTTCVGSQRQGKEGILPVILPNGTHQQLLVTEQERLFGLKPHWTDTGDLSLSDRRKLLGKSWSIDVIKEILKPLAVKFKTLH